MPTGQEWLTYAEWGRKWGRYTPPFHSIFVSLTNEFPGGIIHISLFGQPFIVLNSAAVMDEFDKATAIYSDRPVLQMGGELVGYNQTLVLLHYGSRFRTYRKHISRSFGPGKPIQNIQPVIAQESGRFLKQVMADYENLSRHIRK
jgi:hypothetical protein